VDVPRDLAEDSDEGVYRDEAHPAFDKAARQEAALAETIHAVALANADRFFLQGEGFARGRAGHQPVSVGEIRIHELGGFAGLEVLDRPIHELAQLLAALEADFADLGGRQQIGHLEILRGGVGVENERVVGLPEIASILAVRKIATGGPHGLRRMTWAGISVRRPLRNSSAQPACGVMIPPVKRRPVCII